MYGGVLGRDGSGVHSWNECHTLCVCMDYVVIGDHI